MKNIILITMALALFSVSAFAQTGRDIALKVKDRPDGDTRKSELVMKLINKRGSVRERRIISYSMDVGKDKKDRKSLMFFEYPADVKGTGFLTWDYDSPEKDDDKWLYLPAMKKTRRISGASAKQDYFMGSDFTYDDMGSRNVDEDEHKLLGEEAIEGNKCWKLESSPKDNRDIYSQRISWIRQDCLIPVKVEYYDKTGALHRSLELSEITKVQGYWLAKKMHMTNVQTGHQTLLEINNPEYDFPIAEADLNINTLQKGRL